MLARAIGHCIRRHPEPANGSSSTPAPIRAPCILEARIKVLQKDWPTFQAQGVTFRRYFLSQGLELRLSGSSVAGEYYQLYNYWSLGDDANRFINIEIKAPDVPEFGAFDAMMAGEEKDLLVPIAKETLPGMDADNRYLRLESSLKTEQLSEFQAELEASPISQWNIGDTYVPLTGNADRIVQVWQISKGDEQTVGDVLKNAQWYNMLSSPVFQILQVTAFDPRHLS